MSKKIDEEKELYINGEPFNPQEIVITAFVQRVCTKVTNEEIISAITNAGSYEPILEHDCWKCPNCEEAYEYDDKHNYCPYCGQHIVWSETHD